MKTLPKGLVIDALVPTWFGSERHAAQLGAVPEQPACSSHLTSEHLLVQCAAGKLSGGMSA